MLLAGVRVHAYLKVSPPLVSGPTLHDVVGPLGRGGSFACTCWHGGCGMVGTRWPGRVGSQGRGGDNRRKLGLGGWGTHQVVVLGTGRLKSSPQVQRRTVCYSRRFQFKAQPG